MTPCINLYAFEHTDEGTQPWQDTSQPPAGYCVYISYHDELGALIEGPEDAEDRDFLTREEADDFWDELRIKYPEAEYDEYNTPYPNNA